MKISMILNVALGIALVFLCYLVTIGKGKEKEQEQEQKQDSSEVVINNILQRTSVRSYEDRPVEKEKIEKLLRAGMAAPTAVNKQPWHFIVVTDKNQLEKLAEANPNAGMAAERDATEKAESLCPEGPSEDIDYIIRHALGKRLSEEEILEAKHYARELKYPKGALVFNGTDEDDFMYCLPDNKEISVYREMAKSMGFPKLEV